MEFFSQMTNQFWLKFCVPVPFNIVHLYTKTQIKWMHWYRDKYKLAVGYSDQFLQIHVTEWCEIYRGCSSQYNSYSYEISCDLDELFLRYVNFKFLTNWLLKNWSIYILRFHMAFGVLKSALISIFYFNSLYQ